MVRIRVIDNGIGVNNIDKEDIFRLFTRASDRSVTGGIGLYLSKMATTRLGGEVILANTSPNGSEFNLLIPTDLRPIIDVRLQQEENHRREKEMRLQKLTTTSVDQ